MSNATLINIKTAFCFFFLCNSHFAIIIFAMLKDFYDTETATVICGTHQLSYNTPRLPFLCSHKSHMHV